MLHLFKLLIQMRIRVNIGNFWYYAWMKVYFWFDLHGLGSVADLGFCK